MYIPFVIPFNLFIAVTMHTQESLSHLKRPELLIIAKEHEIKIGRKKNVELVEEILEKLSESGAADGMLTIL